MSKEKYSIAGELILIREGIASQLHVLDMVRQNLEMQHSALQVQISRVIEEAKKVKE